MLAIVMLNALMTSSSSTVKVILMAGNPPTRTLDWVNTDLVALRWTSGKPTKPLRPSLLILAQVVEPRDVKALNAEIMVPVIEQKEFAINLDVIFLLTASETTTFLEKGHNSP